MNISGSFQFEDQIIQLDKENGLENMVEAYHRVRLKLANFILDHQHKNDSYQLTSDGYILEYSPKLLNQSQRYPSFSADSMFLPFSANRDSGNVLVFMPFTINLILNIVMDMVSPKAWHWNIFRQYMNNKPELIWNPNKVKLRTDAFDSALVAISEKVVFKYNSCMYNSFLYARYFMPPDKKRFDYTLRHSFPDSFIKFCSFYQSIDFENSLRNLIEVNAIIRYLDENLDTIFSKSLQ